MHRENSAWSEGSSRASSRSALPIFVSSAQLGIRPQRSTSIRRSIRSAAVSRSRRHVRTAQRTLAAAFDDACDGTHYAHAGAGVLDINSE